MSSKRVTRHGVSAGGESSLKGILKEGRGGVEGSSVLPPNFRPMVALLEGRDCSVEMSILKDVATVAFCDATSIAEIHQKVFLESWGIFLWDRIQLTAEELEKFRSLKVIVKIGPGVENVDLEAAAQKQIAVCNVDGYGIEEAADTTIGMILNLFRRINWFDKMVKDGNDFKNFENIEEEGGICSRIRGHILGLIGLGRVGVAVALRAKAFGFNVIFFDPYLEDGYENSYGLTRVHNMTELLVQSHCVSLHCGLRGIDSPIINDYTIHLMRPGAFLVNVSHRRLVDEVSVAKALRENKIKGAALTTIVNDVAHAHEPLKDVPNLICIPHPHSAFLSEASRAEFRQAAATEMRRAILDGIPGTLRYLKNKEQLTMRAKDLSTLPVLPSPRGIIAYAGVNYSAAAAANAQGPSSRTSPDSATYNNPRFQ